MNTFKKEKKKKVERVYGYMLTIQKSEFDSRSLTSKPMKYTDAVMNYCRMGVIRKGTKTKNGKTRDRFFQDFSGMKIKPVIY